MAYDLLLIDDTNSITLLSLIYTSALAFPLRREQTIPTDEVSHIADSKPIQIKQFSKPCRSSSQAQAAYTCPKLCLSAAHAHIFGVCKRVCEGKLVLKAA